MMVDAIIGAAETAIQQALGDSLGSTGFEPAISSVSVIHRLSPTHGA